MARKLSFLTSLLVSLGVLSVAPSSSAVPSLFTQQGRLFDGAGAPLSGPVIFRFSVYDTPTGGTPLWSEVQPITLEDGYFSSVLGSVTPIPLTVFEGKQKYLGVTVGNDTEMAPRQPLVSVPYALVSNNATGDITPTTVSVGGVAVINAKGEWVGAPTRPNWTAGAGLDLTATTLSVDPTDFMAPPVHVQQAASVVVDTLYSTGENIGSATLTPPVAGTVVAFASADVNCNLTADNTSVSLYHTLTTASTGTAATLSYSYGTYYYQNASDSFFPATNMGRFAAAAGAATTVYWRGGIVTTGDSCTFQRSKITLMFVPD
ncbi:MAG: hypothetical protein ACOY0T_10040 [Myxococcota bacterium]